MYVATLSIPSFYFARGLEAPAAPLLPNHTGAVLLKIPKVQVNANPAFLFFFGWFDHKGVYERGARDLRGFCSELHGDFFFFFGHLGLSVCSFMKDLKKIMFLYIYVPV